MLLALTILLLTNYILAYEGEHRSFYDLEEAEDYFSWFVKEYNKTYTKYEAKLRFEIFKENLKDVNEKNMGLSSPVFGITMFSDLTSNEFRQRHTCIYLDKELSFNPNTKTDKDVQMVGNVPEQFDWRQRRAVTSVKDQAKCASCWAFAATGSVEAAYAIATGKLVDLAPQQLLDCDHKSHACHGGYPALAFQSILQMGGQEREVDYIYTGREGGPCLFNPSKVAVKLRTYKSYYLQNEEIIKQVLYQEGPLTIAVDSSSFQRYRGGILPQCPFTKLSHAVLLVGYGIENGQRYWTIKNSWGPIFGEQGYIRIPRGVNACGFTSFSIEHAVV